MLNSNPALKSNIDKLWDTFWSGGISNPLTAIEQISYLIFMKRLDEIDKQNVLKSKRLDNFDYNSIFQWTFQHNWENYDKEKLRWSHWSQLPAEEMFPFVRDVVFPFVKELENWNGFAWSLKDASFLIPKASMLSNSVNIIEELHITEQNEDTAWDIYEYLLSEIATAGKNWQFRTPRHIIDAMVEIINPTKNDKILDPACGTAWFLISAYKHILKENTSSTWVIEDEDWKHYLADLLENADWQRIKQKNLHGYDFDSTMVRIANMNSIMHWISNPNINYHDTMGKDFSHEEEFDVVLANPPFTGSIDKSDIHDDFTLGTTKTELLFLELIYQKLTVWGRCAVIVPDGVLFWASNAHKKIREKLVENTWLNAVISLPGWVFKPYAGVSTAILVFTKWDETDKIWFYDIQKEWFSLDDKRAPLAQDQNDLPDMISKYKELVENRKYDTNPEKTDQWFWVDKETVKQNDYDLSISRYKEVEYEPVDYEKPQVLISQIREIEKNILWQIEELDKDS